MTAMPHLPQTNWDYKDQMQQVFINLILNAMQATGSGGKISVSTTFIPQELMRVGR